MINDPYPYITPGGARITEAPAKYMIAWGTNTPKYDPREDKDLGIYRTA